MNLLLENEVDPDGDDTGFWVDGSTVTTRTDTMLSTFKLPKGCRKVTLTRLGNGQRRLALGGFKSTTVSVTGPSDVIDRLRLEVL